MHSTAIDPEVSRPPSTSSTRSKNPELTTQSSHNPSTVPTSLLIPRKSATFHRSSSAASQLQIPHSNTAPFLGSASESRRSRGLPTSATWTSSNGDLGLFSDTDETEDRTQFVIEYNRLAKKHGVRVLVVGDFSEAKRLSLPAVMPEKRRWWTRLLRIPSRDRRSERLPPQPQSLRHKRSASDVAFHFMQAKREPPKTLTLETMIRLSGKSLLYLPPEYAPGSLVLPTCFRATAQYLAQHGVVTRGIFRIPGSFRVVNALYNYYCFETDEEITRTTRCPNLPLHIKAGACDVASAFKKFLGVLPGGILGSLSVFDALIAIHSQLRGEPEFNRTRQTKLRARLIALAIGTVPSQFRRELICAVFGLLSLIGRQAEITPHEDDQGRPLPTSDLMGYNALSIVFGPLLIGELLDSYTMRLAHPSSGLLLFPLTPPKLRSERARKGISSSGPRTVDKIHVANEITEMVITHWREVVRHLKSLGLPSSKTGMAEAQQTDDDFLRPSISEAFAIRQPPEEWEVINGADNTKESVGRSAPETPTPTSRLGMFRGYSTSQSLADTLLVNRTKSKPPFPENPNRVSLRQSLNPLSPTVEESFSAAVSPSQLTPIMRSTGIENQLDTAQAEASAAPSPRLSDARLESGIWQNSPNPAGSLGDHPNIALPYQSVDNTCPGLDYGQTSSVSLVTPPPYSSSGQPRGKSPPKSTISESVSRLASGRQSLQARLLCQSTGSEGGDELDETTASKKTPIRSSPREKRKTSSVPSPRSGVPSPRLRWWSGKKHDDVGDVSPNKTAELVNMKKKPVADADADAAQAGRRNQSPPLRPPGVGYMSENSQIVKERQQSTTPASDTAKVTGQITKWSPSPLSEMRSQKRTQGQEEEVAVGDDSGNMGTRFEDRGFARVRSTRDNAGEFNESAWISPMQEPRLMSPPELLAGSHDARATAMSHSSEVPSRSSSLMRHSPSVFGENRRPPSSAGIVAGSGDTMTRQRTASMASMAAEVAERSRASILRVPATPSKSSLGRPALSTPLLQQSEPRPSSVRAMAAMWEGASNDVSVSPSLAGVKGRQRTHSQSSSKAKSATKPLSVRSLRSLFNEDADEPPPPAMLEAKTMQRGSSLKRQLRTSASDSATLRAGIRTNEVAIGNKPEIFQQVRLRTTSGPWVRATHLDTGEYISWENENGYPRSLGTMLPHQEEPPVDKHINFSRPPSALSTATARGHGEQASEGQELAVLPLAPPSPSSTRGNCLLHAQIRNLQRQLEARIEEAASLRRQLEAQEDTDIGTLSELLRETKRECAMWKSRAEAAEKRVVAFEKFTAKLRGIQATAHKTTNAPMKMETQDGTADAGADEARAEMQTEGWRSECGSTGTSGTKDAETVAVRIRESLQALNVHAVGSDYDGDRAGWWVEGQGGKAKAIPGGNSPFARGELEGDDADVFQRARDIWAAAEQLLAEDDMLKSTQTGLSGPWEERDPWPTL